MVEVAEMRVRLGLSEEDFSSDELISALLAEAEAYARTFCRLRAEEAVPDYLIVRMVMEDYGRIDGAGMASRSVSGVTERYLTGYSDAVMASLRALRHPVGRENA